MIYEYEISVFLRILVICLLAGLLGWERESAGKAAGLRTHILVGIATVLFVAIGESMARGFRAFGDHVRFDAANLLGAIVTGISFLGAGMIIFRQHHHEDVKGLTTAAGILTTAAIGVLVGMEKFLLALGATAIVFIILRFVNLLEPKNRMRRATDRAEAGTGDLVKSDKS
jgi:putative Mg2+ transporter-C (MgtC) family protein